MITACSDVGIFYALEIEEVIEDNNNLNDSARFSIMVDTDTVGDGYYIANAGPTVYYRKNVDSFNNWSKLSVPTSGYSSDATTSSMVLIGTDLYISRISHDGSNVYSGIYRLDAVEAEIDLDGVQSNDWTEITSNTGSASSFKFYKLFEANGNLYVNETSRNDDDDFNITDSTVYQTASPGFGGDAYGAYNDITSALSITTTEQVVDAEFDGTNYWIIYNDVATEDGYTVFDDVATFATTPTLTNKDAMVVDMFFYDNATDYVLISNLNSDIYMYQVGSGWVSDIDNGDDFIFRGFADIEDLSANTVIVGTSAYGTESPDGYYQINMSTLSIEDKADNFFSDSSNYSSSDLSDASIVGFLMDSQNDRLFAYTEDEGVWLNINKEWSLE